MRRRAFFEIMAFVFLTFSFLSAQEITILDTVANASGWFGGDNRPGIGPRSVGIAQAVRADTNMHITSFAFFLKRRFDYDSNPEGKGHKVTLRFQLRDSLGSILQSSDVVVPDTFTGGWVSWQNIGAWVKKGDKRIVSCYLLGAMDTAQYSSSYAGDKDGGYKAGDHYVISFTDTTKNIDDWQLWKKHTWDTNFRLSGEIVPTFVESNKTTLSVQSFELAPNFPNPFNPNTRIQIRVNRNSRLKIEIFNLKGQLVKRIYWGKLTTGTHQFSWDGKDQAGQQSPSGTYFLRVSDGQTLTVQKMQLVR